MPTPIKAHRGSGPDDNAPHILVVDDDSRIRDLLARYLQDHGFRVTTAVDAASARAPPCAASPSTCSFSM